MFTFPHLSLSCKDCTIQVNCCSRDNSNTRLICQNGRLKKEPWPCLRSLFVSREQREAQNRNARQFLEQIITNHYGLTPSAICSQCSDHESVGDWHTRLEKAHPLTRGEKDEILRIAEHLLANSPTKLVTETDKSSFKIFTV